jgi:hypothetical protein
VNPTKMLFLAAIGLSAAACSTTTTTQVVTPGGRVLTTSEQACADYGFVAGSSTFNSCVDREREARMRGRVVATYPETTLSEDARTACYSYGLQPATVAYDRCVGREIDARRYRGESSTVYVPAPTPTYTTVYTAPPYAVTPAATPYVESRNATSAGSRGFRDEYGFRYDGEGNRLDRNGNIISPQSTQP